MIAASFLALVTLTANTLPDYLACMRERMHPADAPHELTNPDYVMRPGPSQIFEAAPPATIRIASTVRIGCFVAVSGELVRCRVVSETPTSARNGEAAMRLTPFFRMRPAALDGQPVESCEIFIPLHFEPG